MFVDCVGARLCVCVCVCVRVRERERGERERERRERMYVRESVCVRERESVG